MINLYSPTWVSPWNLTPAEWASVKTAVRNLIYPGGVIQSKSDVVEPNFPLALFTNCASITRLTVLQPGGRVCTEPQHQFLCYPTAPLITDKIFVFMCGHVAPANTNYYIQNNGSSAIVRMLGEGWPVLVVPMPSFDWATGPNPQHITVGGVLTNVVEHDYYTLDHDGGPSATRMFSDQVLRACNQCDDLLGHPSKWVIAGHSGGGCTMPYLTLLDDRFNADYFFEGGISIPLGAPNVGISDYEQSLTVNPVFTTGHPQSSDTWGLFRLGAYCDNRRSGLTSAIHDEYWPINNIPLWYEEAFKVEECIKAPGASVALYLEDSTHDMTPARVTWMMNDLRSIGLL